MDNYENVLEHQQRRINVKLDMWIVQEDNKYLIKQLLKLPGVHEPSTAAVYDDYTEAHCGLQAMQTMFSPVTIEGSEVDVKQLMEGD